MGLLFRSNCFSLELFFLSLSFLHNLFLFFRPSSKPFCSLGLFINKVLSLMTTPESNDFGAGCGELNLPSYQDLTSALQVVPEIYVARRWVETLLPHGKKLFDGLPETANCLLSVGKSRYRVHWQVLWVNSRLALQSKRRLRW